MMTFLFKSKAEQMTSKMCFILLDMRYLDHVRSRADSPVSPFTSDSSDRWAFFV